MCSLQGNYDVIRNWERFETGPLTVYGMLGQVWYLIVSIPDLYRFSYFYWAKLCLILLCLARMEAF